MPAQPHGQARYPSYSSAASAHIFVPPPPPPAVRHDDKDAINSSTASSANERIMRRSGLVLEHPSVGREQAETVLAKIISWLSPPVQPQIHGALVSSRVLVALVQSFKKWRDDPPVVALACVATARANMASTALAQAGVLEEIGLLMDRHPHHGGVQNVCLLSLCELGKDIGIARHSVSLGMVARILRAMETSTGREVQNNGCVVLRLLAESGHAPRTGIQEAAFQAKASYSNDSNLCSNANDLLAIVTPRFKEVLCWHWRSGWCRMGPRCSYAHGPEDLRGNKNGLCEEDNSMMGGDDNKVCANGQEQMPSWPRHVPPRCG
eukprot:gnl/TRDRNA2_/TRDRNA2_154416_c0_seq3.p1 gnl/TRDRNA2_/TRDRNA2_154416_c0~~gnl/TRDRNA2_/TRDRNA2_154416_c0_seq3.p1  ORF type:complete len:322 (-),score=48.44 gnl/TRDRNA2_/TRDRNA2_154416_c0_seq3:139-1104(-)